MPIIYYSYAMYATYIVMNVLRAKIKNTHE